MTSGLTRDEFVQRLDNRLELFVIALCKSSGKMGHFLNRRLFDSHIASKYTSRLITLATNNHAESDLITLFGKKIQELVDDIPGCLIKMNIN